MVQLLIDYEEYEDVIMGVYDVLHLLIQISHNENQRKVKSNRSNQQHQLID
jgi:hypothetical protein